MDLGLAHSPRALSGPCTCAIVRCDSHSLSWYRLKPCPDRPPLGAIGHAYQAPKFVVRVSALTIGHACPPNDAHQDGHRNQGLNMKPCLRAKGCLHPLWASPCSRPLHCDLGGGCAFFLCLPVYAICYLYTTARARARSLSYSRHNRGSLSLAVHDVCVCVGRSRVCGGGAAGAAGHPSSLSRCACSRHSRSRLARSRARVCRLSSLRVSRLVGVQYNGQPRNSQNA